MSERTANSARGGEGLQRSARGPWARRFRRLVPSGLSGSLLLELPDGRHLRFGRPESGAAAVLRLRKRRALGTILRHGTNGFGDAYIDGDVDSPDLVSLFGFYLRNRDLFDRRFPGLAAFTWLARLAHGLRRNSRRGSRRNISAHYDLGNDFYRLWLDDGLTYSSGYFADGAATLEDAQQAKFALVSEMLQPAPGDTLLEIGSGWGALACDLARRHQLEVTGITLSREQLRHAREQAARQGLQQRCRFSLQDYRDTTGTFDRIVSIEMIEAVGMAYWREYFERLNALLKPGGRAVIQSITIDEELFTGYSRSPDFIQRHIFPGGMLPTKRAIAEEAERAGLLLDEAFAFGPCYARTLQEWRRRFEAAWPRIAALGFDEAFRRKWRYYLAYCEAGFAHGAIDVGLYRFKKTG